jgi:integrase
MAPKPRKTDKHLPPRVYIKHNAFYYVDVKNKWHRLGANFSEAMAAWTKLINRPEHAHIMNQLFDRYMFEVAPLKSPASYKANLIQISPLRIWFGNMKPDEVTPVDIYKYIDKRSIKAKVGANREKSLLSHVFSMAIRWGIVRDNPCRNVKRITEKPRTRYIEDHEFLAVKNIASSQINLIMDFAYLTGQRIGDILTIKMTDISENGIKIEQNKTGSKLIIGWSDELSECVFKIKKLPRSVIHSITLFCNRRGGPLTYSGFSSIFKRIMKKALLDGLIKEPFTFHDIRAKAASDAKNLRQASDLLGHSNTKFTEKTYIRNHKKVVPIK